MAKDLVTAKEIMDIQKSVEIINNDIVEASRMNMINGSSLEEFIYHHFLNRIDPIEYCENVLRWHLPESRRKLHENQTAFIRAVCNPKLKQVAGMMSRQCLGEDEIIHTRDGKLVRIKDYEESWITRKKTDVWQIKAKYGFMLRCTHNHPIRTQNGWKKAGELQKGDKICCLYQWNKFSDGNIPYDFDLEDKHYTGVFVADNEFAYYFGKISGKYLQYVDRDDIPKIEDMYNELPKHIVEQYKKLNNVKDFNEAYWQHKMLLMKYLVRVTQFDKNNYFCWCINHFTREQVIHFIKGVLEVNGRFTYIPDSKKQICRVRCKTSLVYAEILHELLNKLGVYSEVYSKGKGTDKRYKLLFDVHMYEDIMRQVVPQKILENDIGWREMPFKVEEIGDDGEEFFYSDFEERVYDGKSNTYDCEFPDKGWFICGGIKTHNSGKCFAKGTKILMYDGSEKNVEDIQVGDKVMSPKGEAITVKELGNGTEEMFEITPSTGITFTVNKSHILSLKNERGVVENISVENFIKKKKNEQYKYKGYRVIIDYSSKKLEIDPYIYGYLLGSDGEYLPIVDLTHDTLKTLYKYMRMYNLKCSAVPKDVSGVIVSWSDDNVYDKYIIDDVLFNTVDVRRKFLSGLIESYWHKSTSRFVRDDKLIMEFTSDRLMKDVIRLCNSIGISTKLEERNTGSFLYLYGDFSVLKLSNKKPRMENKLEFSFDITTKGVGRYYGFTIDSKDHLFLLSDYTVVHNTESISSFCGYLIDNYPQMRIGVFTPRLQQAEVSIGRLSTFFQMNETRLNNRIVKITKDRIELGNDSYVTAVSASDQSNIEGLTFDVIVMDEAQKISDYTVSERVLPMGTATNGKFVKVGTPKTRNHFYDSIEGKASNQWTVIKRDWTRCPQSWLLDATYLPDPDTGIVRPYSTFIIKQVMPKSLKQEMFPDNPEVWTEGNLSIEDFRTQYMLEFIDGAGKYLDSQQVKAMIDGEYDWIDHGIIGETYVAGIDFAGSNPEGDSTQITVLRITRDGIKQKVFAKEFKDASYPEQMYYISHLFGGYKPRFECKKIFADYTGCGAAVVQTLQEEFGLKNIEGIIFNARDKYTNSGMNLKNAMYGKWRQELDNGKFKYLTKERFLNSTADGAGKDNISYYHRMVSEWSDLEQTTTGFSVNKKIEAPSGYHDDVCDADVLANFAAVAGQRSHMPRPVRGRLYR